MSEKHSDILVVEDDMVDILTIKRAVKQLNITNQIIYRHNGIEALSYLETCDDLPGLILLDLNMPKMNGIEFLEIIRSKPIFSSLPVVILTTSQEQSDKMQSFNLSISGYMVKPVDYDKFKDMLQTIHHYWQISELPY